MPAAASEQKQDYGIGCASQSVQMRATTTTTNKNAQKKHFYSAAFHELIAPLDRLILAVVLQRYCSLSRCSAVLIEIEASPVNKYFPSINVRNKNDKQIFGATQELREIVLAAFRGGNEVLQAALSLQAFVLSVELYGLMVVVCLLLSVIHLWNTLLKLVFTSLTIMTIRTIQKHPPLRLICPRVILKHLSSRFGSTDRLPLPSYLTCFEFEHDVI